MLSPDKALNKLLDGNKRFASGESIHPNLGKELRESLINDQKPYAAIVACSDSRVPIEIIFDAGLGDLFVIRTAGHVPSKESLGSLEYAVKELGVKLVMILGHDNCGAVKTAINVYKSQTFDELSENLQTLLSHIYPVLDDLDLSCPDALEQAVEANIRYQIQDLIKRDKYLEDKINQKEIILVGAKYNLNNGEIEVMGENENCLCS